MLKYVIVIRNTDLRWSEKEAVHKDCPRKKKKKKKKVDVRKIFVIRTFCYKLVQGFRVTFKSLEL